MIFAILGILVLVVSFVIALITLVREQGSIDDVGVAAKSEGDKDAVVVQTIKKEPVDRLVAHKAEELNPYQKPPDAPFANVTSGDTLDEASASLEAETPVGVSEGKPHVWWERLDERDDSLGETNEDEQSIEKIRQELAKLMSTKANTEVTDEPEADLSQEPTLGGLTASTLSGEFSLREMKKKD